jgi:hypothetical protein
MTDTTVTTGTPPHVVTRAWRAFTHFRRSRPFWGALILAVGGYFVARPVLGGSWAFYAAVGAKGMAPMMLGVAMAAAAGVCLLLPAQRHFPSVVATMLSIASLPLANLGGWIVGMVLGIVGSALCFAWAPYTDKQLARFAAKEQRKQERRAARHAAKEQAAAA